MPAIGDPTTLRQVSLFRDLALQELAVLNGFMRRHLLPAGARIVMTDQLEDTAYIIQSGLVKTVAENADGSELIQAILGPGDVISALTIGETATGAHSIVPLEETQLLWIDRHVFERCVRTMPILSSNLAHVLAHRILLSNRRIEALAGMDVRTRLVRHLLLLASEYGTAIDYGSGESIRIPLRLTQADLARLVGASRVRVNHALADLRRRQILETAGDHFLLIRDIAELGKLS